MNNWAAVWSSLNCLFQWGQLIQQSFIHLGIKLGICVQGDIMGYRGKENKDQKAFGGGNHSRKTVLQELQ